MALIQKIRAMNEDLIAYHTVVSGEFAKEIARLTDLQNSIDARLGMMQTMEDAQAAANLLIQQAQDKLDSADALNAKATAAMSDASKAATDAQNKANDARALELEVKDEWDALQKAKEDHAANVASITETLAQQQNDLNKSAADVAAQKAAIDAKAMKIAQAIQAS